jgi:phage terminase large subunit GpA-like protein
MASLVCDWLQALHSQSLGDDSDMIVFINSKRGEEYEYGEVKRDPDSLSKYAKDYEELVCPADGLMVTIGVDVQHDRLAIVVRAWGRDGKSWLIYFTEIAARVSCKDSKDPVWSGLDTIVFQAFEHECGAAIYASAISIDSSDGMTAEAVYEWVRTRKADRSKRRFDIMAIKGSSDTADDRPIYSAVKPKPIDHKKNSKLTKADKFGVTVHMVGTTRAKDLIDGQLELLQKGRGRFFYYSSVRSDYFAQLCAEVKAPHRSVKNRLVWQQKPGHPCEAWDCEVYALHAAYHCRVHLLKPAEWDRLENKLKQEDLFSAPSDADGAAKGDAEGGASSSSPAGQSGGWLGNSSGENWL